MISTTFALLAIIASCARAAPASSSSVTFSRGPDEPTPSSVVDTPRRLQEPSMSTSDVLEPTISVTDSVEPSMSITESDTLEMKPTHTPVSSASSTPSTQAKKKLVVTEGGKDTGRLIVMYKEGVDSVRALQATNAEDVTHLSIINGAVVKRTNVTLEALLSDPDVESVHEDGIAYASKEDALIRQNNAPWGLQRLSSKTAIRPGSNPNTLNFQYVSDDKAGRGVDIYVIDTGVNKRHYEFQGRANNNFFVSPWTNGEDDNGHGTHCSGTVAGVTFGVAKAANIQGVKVLGGPKGSGSYSGIIQGMQIVLQQCQKNGRPCVASMSLGGPGSDPVDRAAAQLAASNIHTVIAAGNDNKDAKDYSPARASSNSNTITVGATDINDGKASFSNFGRPLTIHAPGVNVISATHDSNTGLLALSGTSMATPHISGLIAYWISIYGNGSPATLKNYLVQQSLKNVIRGIPAGTVNLLAYNGNGQQ
ncbi:peptidase S8/S53 domain-containing protein [Flagelloscypha sp. PMI_526]|nr:peptidase S8/S53 domain-containing protein [Flagelloscypha sp. PMI_526]